MKLEPPSRSSSVTVGQSNQSLNGSIGQNDVRSNLFGPLGVVVASFVFCYASVIASLVEEWWSNDSYSFGFLIPCISGYLLWMRRKALRQFSPVPAYLSGIVLLFFGLLMLLIGKAGGILVVQQISLIFSLGGVVLFVLGKKILREVASSLVYLLFMIPIWEIITDQLHGPFQIFSATLGVSILRFLEIPANQDGIYLHLPNITLEVARSCSGVNYLIAVIAMGIPLGIVFLRDWKKTILLLCFAVTIAGLSNGIRVALIGLLSYHGFQGALHGPFHMLQGLFVSMIGFVALIAGLILLSLGPKFNSLSQNDPPFRWPDLTMTGQKERWIIAICLSLIFLGVANVQQFYRVRPMPTEKSLNTFPAEIAGFRGKDTKPLFPGKGADQELSRLYSSASGDALSLYVGYYNYQEQGKEIIGDQTKELLGKAQSIDLEANPSQKQQISKVIEQYGGRSKIIFFWFELNGRSVTNPYLAKAYTVWDVLKNRRSNGAIVLVSIEFSGEGPEKHLLAKSNEFLKELVPLLNDYLRSVEPDSV